MIRTSLTLLAAGAALTLAACQPGEDSAPAAAQEEARFPHEVSDLAPDSEVRYGALDNGLRYAIMQNDTPSGGSALRLRVDMGSLMEAETQRGLAHFLEHMAFNGSANVPEGEMVKILERSGLAFGPDTNASTSFNETIYMLDLPESDAETLDTAFFLMSELDDLTLDAGAIDRERGVILSEKRVRNSPGLRAFVAQSEFLYPDALFPARLPIGVDEVLETAQRERFVDLYRRYYRPENVFFVAVGDFEPDAIETRIEEAFCDWTVEGEAGGEPELGGVAERGLEAGYFHDPALPTSVSINYVAPYEDRPDTTQTRREDLLRGLGNAILSRRFASMARGESPPFLNAGASYGELLETAASSSVATTVQAGGWREGLAAIEQELRRAVEFGFTHAELDEQLANVRTAYRNAADQSETRDTFALASAITGAFGGEDVFQHPDDALARFEAMEDSLTLEAVEAAFRAQWTDDTPLLYLTSSEPVDNAEQALIAAFEESRSTAVEAGEEAAAAEFAYADFGAPGAVATRETIEDLGVTTVVFDNNVRLNIKPTDFEDDSVLLKMRFGGGLRATPRDNAAAQFLFSNAFAEGGLGAHSADEVQRLFAGKSVSLNFGIETDAFNASAATTPDDLDDQLALWTAYMSDPGYRDEAFARFQQVYGVFYETLGGNPQSVVQRDVTRVLNSGDPRFGYPEPSEVAALSSEDGQALIEPARTQAALEVGVVGDVDVEAVIEAVAATLGALPARALERETYDEGRDVSFTDRTEPLSFTHEGEPDRGLALVYWPAPDASDEQRRRRLILLTEIFQLKLTERIREQEAATYSPSVGYSGSREFPGYGYIQATLDLQPEDVEPFFAVVDELAADMREGRFDADELERARRPLLESVEENQERNGYWLSFVAEAQTDPDGLERHRTVREDYESLTLEGLQAEAAAYWDPDTALRVSVLPEPDADAAQ